MMKYILFLSCLLIGSLQYIWAQSSRLNQYIQFGIFDDDCIPSEEYRTRRATAMSLMDSGSVAIFRANDFDNRNGDIDYEFRQNDNFLYLTGCNESNSTLILIPHGFQIDSSRFVTEMLFINERVKSWAGDRLGIEGAKEVLGFGLNSSAVLANDKLKEIIPSILKSVKVLYYTPSLLEIAFDPISEKKFISTREVKKGLEEKYAGLTVKSAGIIINDLRVVKSQTELVYLQKAIDATVTGFIEAAKSCEPEMFEYQLQAAIEYCFINMGCEYQGFPSIIGSGSNTLSYHYESNRRQMKQGDLVVIDIGAEYHGYSADVSRTIPVSGTFTSEQRSIYEIVLNAQTEAIKEIKPGAMMNAPSKRAMDVLGEGLVKIGIIQNKEDTKIYCPHGVSHFIGLGAHDVGSRWKLVPGMVLTMEPGLYILDSSQCEKKYKGIGIRIEDDILVTESGPKVLSERAPKTVSDIEKLMKLKGIGNIEIGKSK